MQGYPEAQLWSDVSVAGGKSQRGGGPPRTRRLTGRALGSLQACFSICKMVSHGLSGVGGIETPLGGYTGITQRPFQTTESSPEIQLCACPVP